MSDYERRSRPKRYYKCSDRMCGAEDCPRCHPGNFVNGVFVDDIEEEEEVDEVDDEEEENEKPIKA